MNIHATFPFSPSIYLSCMKHNFDKNMYIVGLERFVGTSSITKIINFGASQLLLLQDCSILGTSPSFLQRFFSGFLDEFK